MMRPALATDRPAILGLLRNAKLPADDLTGATETQFWVLESAQSLVGVVGLDRYGSIALLRSLAMAPDYRGRGHARELVANLEHHARDQGVEQLVLLTETAASLFERLGYRVVERRDIGDDIKQSAEFRSLCPASAVCMTKFLSVLAPG